MKNGKKETSKLFEICQEAVFSAPTCQEETIAVPCLPTLQKHAVGHAPLCLHFHRRDQDQDHRHQFADNHQRLAGTIVLALPATLHQHAQL